MVEKIGVTGIGDAMLNLAWVPWVESGNPAILITKAIKRIYMLLSSGKLKTDRLIVHCTITGWGDTPMEPFVNGYLEELCYYRYLKDLLPGRVVLRLDPVIPTEEGVSRARAVVIAAGLTSQDRIKVSFMHNYDHINERMRDRNLPEIEGFDAPLEFRKNVIDELRSLTQGRLQICGEPGMENTGCISEEDCILLGVTPSTELAKKPGQLEECACLSNKHELLADDQPCAHNCAYCFWEGCPEH